MVLKSVNATFRNIVTVIVGRNELERMVDRVKERLCGGGQFIVEDMHFGCESTMTKGFAEGE